VSKNSIADFESQNARSNFDNFTSHVGAHDERVCEPTVHEVAAFLDQPVQRVDGDGMVLEDDLVSFGGSVGCRSDNEFRGFLSLEIGCSVGGSHFD
jgi:hypothetical protein